MVDLAAGLEMRTDEPLARHTSVRAGGRARHFAVVHNSEQLERAVRWGASQGLDLLILGAGSNVVVSDAGWPGLVIKSISRRVALRADEGGEITVELDAGTFLPTAARRLAELGVAGLEWGVGIPGTAGGAVVGNAGAYGGETAETLSEIDVLTASGEVETLGAGRLGFAYRSSALKRGEVRAAAVLRARHRLYRAERGSIVATINTLLAERKRKQPVEPSVGSTFKNPPGGHAGAVIERLGLKGSRIGGAVVSPKHANYIINTGGATASDVRNLVEYVQREVFARSGVQLETEIEFKGQW